jgi:hypothetical protein
MVRGWVENEQMATFTMSRTTILAIVGIIVVGMVALAVIMFPPGGGGGGGTTTWHNGDYAEWGTFYYEAGGEPPGDVAGYSRYTVTDVGTSWLTVNLSYSNPARILLTSSTQHYALNGTGIGHSASNLDALTIPVTDLGTDTLTTDLGTLSAHHYQYSYSSGGTTYTVDVWTRGGFILMQKTTQPTGLQQVIAITGTNIPRIYS